MELGEEEDFGDEVTTVVSATSSITSSATSSVTPIQQNVPSTSTPIQHDSSESRNVKRTNFSRETGENIGKLQK